MMDKTAVAGIEVSKEELLVALRREDRTLPLQSFPNTAPSHRAVAHYLARPGRRVRLCMESTGVYGLDLARYCRVKGNPRCRSENGLLWNEESIT